MPTKRVRAAIVGGGIGGLSAASALLLRGIDVTVFEQVDTLREVGTGVSIFPNGRRQLERMGLKKALAQVGAKVGDGSEYYRMDGTVVGPILNTDSSGWNGVYGMHRADLSRVLAEALPGATIRTAHRCVGFEQNAHVAQLKFTNGMTAEADVVIGADGIQSALQKYVVQPSLPEYSGSRAYRGLIPSTKLPEWRKEAHQGPLVTQFIERGMDKSGIRLISSGDLTSDDDLPNMTDAMLGLVTAHHYSMLHKSAVNKAYVDAFRKAYGIRPAFHSVAGYDAMHLLHQALEKISGNTDGDTLVAAMKGMSWESPRGQIAIDPETRDIIQNEYIRRVEKVNGELYNVEFATIEAVKDPFHGAKK